MEAQLHKKPTRQELQNKLDSLNNENKQLYEKLRDINTVLDSPNWHAFKKRQREIWLETQALRKEISDMDYKEKHPTSFPGAVLGELLKGGISSLLHTLNGVDLADQSNAVRIMQTIKKHATPEELEQLFTIFNACQKRAK